MSDIRFERRGAVGLVTLDRPKALNALSHDMVRRMRTALDEWATDPEVAQVVLRGAGERAFCAGGDVRAIWALGRAGRIEEARQFFRDEYALNLAISRYPKPFISLVDGLCFGGGFGLSGHGRFRVAGERVGFAMPEIAIGLYPDVGAGFVLPRLPGWSGIWLGLIGARIGLSDAMALGLYSHHVPAERWDDLVEALAAGDSAGDVLDRFAAVPPLPSLAPLYPFIDRVFAGGSVAAILAALDHAAAGEGIEAEFAALQAQTLRRGSPTAVALAFTHLKRGLGLDLAGCLTEEFRAMSRILAGPDFYEGIRALLIDKDGAPRWQPARLEEVDLAAIDRMFAEPLADELVLPDTAPVTS
ncbi:MAG TPA: enoyl-CoA hydratase/isomerase family protein [Xanthobacteraceae bacterium]|nr:enoyl-CoA hydratase/isomerase family protein [Xanthobacteraceae bacterium]